MKVQDERAIRKAARPLLPAREFQVLMALVEFSDPKRRCFPSVRRLADDMACSMDTVQRAITGLASKGWIEREERRRADGGRTSSLITILLPAEVVERQREALLMLPLMRVISGGQTCGEQGGQSVDKADPPTAKMRQAPYRKNAVAVTRPTSKDSNNSRTAIHADAPVKAPDEGPPYIAASDPRPMSPPVSPAHGLREGERGQTAGLKRKA